jgi:hypothetical protein
MKEEGESVRRRDAGNNEQQTTTHEQTPRGVLKNMLIANEDVRFN